MKHVHTKVTDIYELMKRQKLVAADSISQHFSFTLNLGLAVFLHSYQLDDPDPFRGEGTAG